MAKRAAVLDNVVWHATQGAQRTLAVTAGEAARFNEDVAPFAAIADLSAPSAWADLGTLIGAGKATVLFAPSIDTPDGWTEEMSIPCLQMVATKVDGTPRETFTELGPADVDDMLAIVAATRPGPFGTRTIELGKYLGHRVDGKLVAMAGERFKAPGFTEVSAVCTTEDVRGRGLARELVLSVVQQIRARGDEAFLHVESKNVPAIALYESLGFTVRCDAEAVIVRRA